jgi:hypothetical protein
MKLRDLKWKGISIWPPDWSGNEGSKGTGEEGVLTRVEFRERKKEQHISIEAEYAGVLRVGILLLENPVRLKALYHKLQENIGKPLVEIGNLDITF